MRTAPEPEFTFRGHQGDVGALHWNARADVFFSGDVRGTVFAWDVATRRPLRYWKAHAAGILGIETCTGLIVPVRKEADPDYNDAERALLEFEQSADGEELLITQGRDDSIKFWRMSDIVQGSGSSLVSPRPGSSSVVIDPQTGRVNSPWSSTAAGDDLTNIGMMHVNTLNFCRISLIQNSRSPADWIISTPGITESELLDVYNLSKQRYVRRSIGFSTKSKETGMAMAQRLFYQSNNPSLQLAVGYETGGVIIWNVEKGEISVRAKLHSEPVMCLHVDPKGEYLVTGSADSVIAKMSTRPIDADVTSKPNEPRWSKIVSIDTPGIADICIRFDGKIIATAGWDNRVRIWSAKSLTPLAILGAHHRSGVQCVAFAGNNASVQSPEESSVQGKRWLLSGSKDTRIQMWDIY
ncbi:WD40-repeat-containing domain protein [Cladochytrium replicatum]|nr:WD40-repeat-containing domain protein [Cladochytrium replicatum]